MYFGSEQRETVSVMGTPAFMEFVESIQNEGVTFERVPMGGAGVNERKDSLVVEVETESRTRTSMRSTSRCRASPAASTVSSRT
jgi:type III restriction enzyme